jgi:hypothetical protein
MADELTVSISGAFSKSGRRVDTKDMGLIGLLFDVAGTDYVKMTQSIATSETALDKGGIGTGGYLFIKNTDATNFVELRGASSGADLVRMNAGEIACFRVTSDATLYGIADTDACVVEYLWIEA